MIKTSFLLSTLSTLIALFALYRWYEDGAWRFGEISNKGILIIALSALIALLCFSGTIWLKKSLSTKDKPSSY